MTPKLAFYARSYSCDQQNKTLIDDQLRRCRDIARQQGLVDDDALVFEDEARSGTFKHTDKRIGYQALLAAWDANKFTVLIVDEFYRLTRDAVEQAQLVRRLENNRRVRLITANGIDTGRLNWQPQVGLVGLIGQQFARDTRLRIQRGMLGQLERGYFVSKPTFGYVDQRDFDSSGKRLGTRWLIVEKEAAVVREIFARRAAGESMQQIAAWLNAKRVTCSHKASALHSGIWRTERIRALLANPIYRGVLHWHGSATHRDKATKQSTEVEERVFPRPELRLVSDETWNRCKAVTAGRPAKLVNETEALGDI